MTATMKAPRGCSDRAMTSNCVRFDDRRGWSCRLNKTGLRTPVKKKLFSYYVKRYEQVCRGGSESAVLKKFEMFRSVSERFQPLTPLPAGFGLLESPEKQSKLMQLVSEQLDDAERICSQLQGVDTQADHPDDMQVGEGSGPYPASEGVANTSLPLDDSSLQNLPLGSVRSDGLPGIPPVFSLDLGSCTLNQLDNPEGRPPPSSRQFPHELNQSMSDLECRASRYPDILPEFDWLKQLYILFVNKLKDQEMNERRWLAWRSNLEEIPSRLPEGIVTEDPQNQLSKASMEDVGFQGRYSPASDFGVKNIETPMPHGEEGGLLQNRSISEALEVVPRLTGRLKKNVGDIRPQLYGCSADVDLPSKPIMKVSPCRPQLYGCSADADLPSKPIMKGFSPQASDLQVRDLCSGGENFTIMPNPGGNNTLQVAIDRFVSAEPSADEREEWAEWQLCQFDMPAQESWTNLWPSPVRHVSIDTLPA